MRKLEKSAFVLLAVAASLALFPAHAGAAAAELAAIGAGGDAVLWQPLATSYDRLVLTVSGPDGVVRREFKPGEAVAFPLFTAAGQRVSDGSYSWELRLEPVVDAAARSALAAARARGDESVPAGVRASLPDVTVQSGSFVIADGSAVVAGETESRGGASSGSAQAGGSVSESSHAVTAADQVIADDLIVQGSACIGLDCVNNESFGFDTLRLKENNTRIKFEDTSVGSFPTEDWQLTANDSASGGANKFSIESIDNSRVPFTITAGAPTNSMFVDSSGRVGLGTATPVLNLHIVSGNTPALRLEQNGSSGFTAQTWDVAGNETVFFVRDVTSGSRLPFKIQPGAATNSLTVTSSSKVGIGTLSPSEKLTVDGGNVDIRVATNTTDNTQVGFNLESTGGTITNTWFARNNPANGAFTITDNAGGLAPFKIFKSIAADTLQVGTAGGAQEVRVTGTLRVNGTAMTVPDYVFEPNYKLESIDQHAETMFAEKHLPALTPSDVGPDGKPSIDIVGHQFGMLAELEKAHIYIAQLNSTVEQLQAASSQKDQAIATLQSEVTRLSLEIEQRLAHLEAKSQ
jgi:hypothetical protein